MPLADLLAMIPPDPEAEQRRSRCLEQVQDVRSRLQVAPNSVTDKEILRCIDCLFHDVLSDAPFSSTPSADAYDELIAALSFTRRPLVDLEAVALKRAWTNFLEENEESLGWPLHEGFVEWYWGREMPLHEIAVLEHVLTEYRLGRLQHDEGNLESWLLSLHQLCVRQNLIPRARHVAELIGDYHEDGFVSLSGYAEILAHSGTLCYREFGQAIEDGRVEAERLLRSNYGPLLQNLHETTRSLVIGAELWSRANLRAIEPAAGPRRWALAVEAEFNAKVFQPNCDQLEPALREGSPDRRLKPNQSCSVRQINRLIRISSRGDMAGATVRAVLDRLLGGHELRAGARLDIPRILLEHRDQIAHVTDRGSYSPAHCNEFLRDVREDGWVFRFLKAIQPR